MLRIRSNGWLGVDQTVLSDSMVGGSATRAKKVMRANEHDNAPMCFMFILLLSLHHTNDSELELELVGVKFLMTLSLSLCVHDRSHRQTGLTDRNPFFTLDKRKYWLVSYSNLIPLLNIVLTFRVEAQKHDTFGLLRNVNHIFNKGIKIE